MKHMSTDERERKRGKFSSEEENVTPYDASQLAVKRGGNDDDDKTIRQ